MNSAFNYQVRFLACSQCGAPLQSALGGGQLSCPYCQAINVVSVRDERPIFEIAPVPPISEEERTQRLRSQDGRPLIPPATVIRLQENGKIPPWKMQEALAVWQNTRQGLRTAQNYEAAELLLYLTIVMGTSLNEQQDLLRERALKESALDVFTLPRHKQVMRSSLSRVACRLGDLQAAEQWLALCDPRSQELEADSQFRFSRALLDTARQDFAAVLRVLGSRNEDVPIQDAIDPSCAVLRANAWERLGNLQAATAVLGQALARGPHFHAAIAGTIAAHSMFQLCPQSQLAALAQAGTMPGAAGPMLGNAGAMVLGANAPALLSAQFTELAQQARERANAASPVSELRERYRKREASGDRINSIVMFVVGLLFAGFALACFGLVAAQLAGAGLAVVSDNGLGGVAIFGLFWTIMATIMGTIGVRGLRRGARTKRLQALGLPGRATVMSYDISNFLVNGRRRVKMHVRIELEGRSPYELDVAEYPISESDVTTGAVIPVKVDPQNPSVLLFDWWSA